ncbi:MAG TPA: hypothetical protein VGI10_01165 [Polyangiaceae bacterium]
MGHSIGAEPASGGSGVGGNSGGAAGSNCVVASNGGDATSTPAPCFDSQGRLVAEAKACQLDSDCEAWPTYTCCGPSTIIAVATSARAFEACYPYPTCCPAGLGCASQASTEDGALAGFGPLEFLVRCVSLDGGPGQCRTESADAGAGVLWVCSGFGAPSCTPAGAP